MSREGMDDADRLGRLWDDRVLGSAGESDADDDLLAMVRGFEAAAQTPPPPSDLASRTWQRLTGGPLPLVPYVPVPAVATNGHHRAAASPRARSTRRDTVYELVRQLAIAALAGMCGGFVTGIWARVMMRLSGIVTDDRNRGLLTENNAVVGQMTFTGTMTIALLGAAMGVVGGLLYVAVRRWLPGSAWQRSAAFGVLLLAVFGYVVMDRHNPDYRLFGPAWMNVGTFSLAYLVFGLVTGATAEWLQQRMPRFGVAGRSTRRRAGVVALLTPLAGIALYALVVLGAGIAGPSGVLVVAVIALARLPVERVVARLHLGALMLRPAYVGYAAVAIPSLVGVTFTVRAIVAIVSG
jgi:hypothetical protein